MSQADLIASSQIVCTRADGTTETVVAGVGVPFLTPEGEWACKAYLQPLIELRDVRGEDSLQALSLALTLVRRSLEYFIADGGSLTHANGEAYEVAVEFGTVGQYLPDGPRP